MFDTVDYATPEAALPAADMLSDRRIREAVTAFQERLGGDLLVDARCSVIGKRKL